MDVMHFVAKKVHNEIRLLALKINENDKWSIVPPAFSDSSSNELLMQDTVLVETAKVDTAMRFEMNFDDELRKTYPSEVIDDKRHIKIRDQVLKLDTNHFIQRHLWPFYTKTQGEEVDEKQRLHYLIDSLRLEHDYLRLTESAHWRSQKNLSHKINKRINVLYKRLGSYERRNDSNNRRSNKHGRRESNAAENNTEAVDEANTNKDQVNGSQENDGVTQDTNDRRTDQVVSAETSTVHQSNGRRGAGGRRRKQSSTNHENGSAEHDRNTGRRERRQRKERKGLSVLLRELETASEVAKKEIAELRMHIVETTGRPVASTTASTADSSSQQEPSTTNEQLTDQQKFADIYLQLQELKHENANLKHEVNHLRLKVLGKKIASSDEISSNGTEQKIEPVSNNTLCSSVPVNSSTGDQPNEAPLIVA